MRTLLTATSISLCGGVGYCAHCGAPRAVAWKAWEKDKHPRKPNGQFGAGGSGSASAPRMATSDPPALGDARSLLAAAGLDVEADVAAVSPDELKTLGLPGMARQFDGTVAGSVFDGKVYIATNTALYKAAAKGDKDAQVMLASVVAHENEHAKGVISELACYQKQLEVFDKMKGGDTHYRQLIVRQIARFRGQPIPTGSR